MLRTVKVPEQFKPIFEKAQGYVDVFFKGKKENPSKGTIEIFGERYILVRAASLSIDFFETVTRMYAKEGKEEALNFARQILFDVAHAIGMHDARNFHKKMDLKDPIEKLSAGPIHFSHSGWAFVDIFPESVLSPDENYYLIYDHPYSFESDAWLRAGKKSDFPVCIMNAGYSSGWCEESFGISLVASEIMCRAKGDHACRFIMAPPSSMEAHIESYMQQEPDLAGRMKNYEVPGFFRSREAEVELRASEEKCRAIFDNAMVGIVLVDVKDKKFVDVNRTICKMLGYRLEEMREMGVLDIFPEEDRHHVAEEFENLTRDKIAPVEDLPVKRKDGTVFYAVVNFSSVTLSGKRYLVGHFGDITKRRHAELLIERLNHQNELILNAAGEGIFGLDIHGNHTFVNPAAARMLGYDVDELTGMHSHTTVHNLKEDGSPYPEDECPIYAAYKDGKVHRIDDDIFRRKDGTSFPVAYTSTPIIENGQNVGAVVTFRDITERRKAEEAIRASEAALHDSYFTQATINMILRESLENIPLEVILQKALNMILSVPWLSFEAVGSIHLAEDETGMLSMKAHYNLPEPLVASCARIPFGDCLCGKAAQTQDIGFADHIDDCHHMNYEGMRNHGHYAVPILFLGKTLGVLNICLKEGHIRDRNEEEFLLAVADTLAGIIARKKAEERHKELEAQLLLAQKMEAVGQLAGGIAHDFNNLLQSIILGIALAKHRSHEDNVKEVLTETENACLKADELSRLLITFAQGGTPVVRKRSITDIVRETVLTTLRASLAEAEFTIPDDLWPVEIDEGQIRLSIKQLVMNAREAMPSGGVLKVFARNLASIATENVPLEEGAYVKVTFADNGPGIAPENLSKIFDPYFTTKAMGSQKGMGLSLTVSQSIVKKHRGIITAESKVGEGARFHIYLPAALT